VLTLPATQVPTAVEIADPPAGHHFPVTAGYPQLVAAKEEDTLMQSEFSVVAPVAGEPDGAPATAMLIETTPAGTEVDEHVDMNDSSTMNHPEGEDAATIEVAISLLFPPLS